MKRIFHLCLLALVLTFFAPVYSIVVDNGGQVACAADAKTQRLREKEKAKIRKQREREKIKKQREREKLKKQRERGKAKNAKAKSPELSAAEEKAQYMTQLAAVEKAHARAAAYLNRDIAHRLGCWGQIGYSNLFASPVFYDQANGIGFLNSDNGFVGGGAGVGYQLRYKRMLMTVGAEFNTYNSVMGIANTPEGTLVRSYAMQPYYDQMTYTYSFSFVRDRLVAGFLQIPIALGMEFKTVPIFWQAGVKIGMGVVGSSSLSGRMTTCIEDKDLITPLTDMYSHSLVTDDPFSRPATSLSWGLNVAATAELGMNLDQWVRTAMPRLRLSLFADYGMLNSLRYAEAPGAQDIPMQMLVSADPLDFPVNSALATTSASEAQVHPFIVGVKMAVWFELPRRAVVPADYPAPPLPRLGVYAYDEESGEPLGGAAVEITSAQTGKVQRRNTNRQGLVKGRFSAGNYRIGVSKNGYHTPDSILHEIPLFTYDTLQIGMRRISEPVAAALCMNIYDMDTREPIEAAVRLTAASDTAVLYEARSADDGFIETPLVSGVYIAHFSAQGYMPADDTIRFVQDTVNTYLRRIREGVKVKIENLFFATNKTVILPVSEAALNDLAQFLVENREVNIRIIGHTDAVGSEEANHILSEGRASAVREELIRRGVEAGRIEAEGRGEKEPVADNDTEEGRALNRRVEFVITDY